jgi:hypothetical protein
VLKSLATPPYCWKFLAVQQSLCEMKTTGLSFEFFNAKSALGVPGTLYPDTMSL